MKAVALSLAVLFVTACSKKPAPIVATAPTTASVATAAAPTTASPATAVAAADVAPTPEPAPDPAPAPDAAPAPEDAPALDDVVAPEATVAAAPDAEPSEPVPTPPLTVGSCTADRVPVTGKFVADWLALAKEIAGADFDAAAIPNVKAAKADICGKTKGLACLYGAPEMGFAVELPDARVWISGPLLSMHESMCGSQSFTFQAGTPVHGLRESMEAEESENADKPGCVAKGRTLEDWLVDPTTNTAVRIKRHDDAKKATKGPALTVTWSGDDLTIKKGCGEEQTIKVSTLPPGENEVSP